MNVNPGELRHKIQFVTVIDGTDTDGFPIHDEDVIYSCNAKITNTSGMEKIKSGTEITDKNTRFLIRYTSVINEDMQIKFGSNYYDIQFIQNYEEKKEYVEVWTIMTKQV